MEGFALRSWCLVAAISVSALSARSQPSAARKSSVRSVSGQFITHDQRRSGPSELALSLAANPDFVVLDPALLSVSCERIKQHLWSELGTVSPPGGKFLLNLHSAESRDEAMTLTSERFSDQWQYQVDLPDVTARAQYVRVIVQVLLLEMANRNTPERSAELPLWLIEGFTRRLLASSEIEIILPPPGKTDNGFSVKLAYFDSRKEREKESPVEHARKVLRARPLFTFEQLSWPVDDQFTGEDREAYCLSAQLFVAGLLEMKEGQACLRQMIADLPQYYNWQFDFLKAFNSAFQRPLDVEKWWTLRWINFTGGDTTLIWPLAESWRQLEEVINSSVQARAANNATPVGAAVGLKTIIRDWEPVKQIDRLESTLNELELLRPRLDPRVAQIAGDYHQTLLGYLQSRNPRRSSTPVKRGVIKRSKEQTLQQLDHLDTLLRAMQPKIEPLAQTRLPASTP